MGKGVGHRIINTVITNLPYLVIELKSPIHTTHYRTLLISIALRNVYFVTTFELGFHLNRYINISTALSMIY